MLDSIMQNQQCDTIIFSDKSFLGIVAETYERSQTETGGILLGKIIGNTWYVIESLDPGPNSIFQQSYLALLSIVGKWYNRDTVNRR